MNMPLTKIALAALALSGAAGAHAFDAAAAAAAAAALAYKNDCLSCHAVDKKIFVPAFHDVAAKHKEQTSASETVAARIQSSDSEMYGLVPMPPKPTPEDGELKVLEAQVFAWAPDK